MGTRTAAARRRTLPPPADEPGGELGGRPERREEDVAGADRKLRLRGAAARHRDGGAIRGALVAGVREHEAVEGRKAASGIGWNATILRRGKRGASASNRSSAVRVPPKARAGLSVGTRRLRRGPAADVASRFGATRWSSATPSRPSREAAAAALALLDADVAAGPPAHRIASRTPRARAVSRPSVARSGGSWARRQSTDRDPSRSHPFQASRSAAYPQSWPAPSAAASAVSAPFAAAEPIRRASPSSAT